MPGREGFTKEYPSMNAPTYCRTTGQRIGLCYCLRCKPVKESDHE